MVLLHPALQGEKYVILSLPHTGSNRVDVQLHISTHIELSVPELELQIDR